MKALTRRNRILAHLNAMGEKPVAELAIEFGVSQMTIRRDLDTLAKENRVMRTHGGAASTARVMFDFQFLAREESHRDAKAAIAQAAAAQLGSGESVVLDSGTTTLAVARALKACAIKTVVTTSLPIASELQYVADIELILLGGTLRRESPDLAGPMTEMNVEGLRVDVAFLGADAVDTAGTAYSHSLELARLLMKLAKSARRVYIVADSSKVGHTALARIGNVNEWSGLITDSAVTRSAMTALKLAGVQVIRADVEAKTTKRMTLSKGRAAHADPAALCSNMFKSKT